MSEPCAAEMFAVRDGDWLHSFFPSIRACRMCDSKNPVVRVLVSPDESGDYCSWWSNERWTLDYTNSSRRGGEVCFTYGSKVEEERGRGKVIRVRVDVLREATADELR